MRRARGVTEGFLGFVLLAACSSNAVEGRRTPVEGSGAGDAGLGGARGGDGGRGNSGGGGTNSTGGKSMPVRRDERDAQPDIGAGGREIDATPTHDSATDCKEGLVWKPTSSRVAISSFGFWDGSMRYEKDAVDLSGEQLSALRNLCLIRPPTSTGADFTSYRLTITDANGTTATFRAAEGDIGDSDEGNIDGIRSISFESLSRFLATFDCRTAKGGPFPGPAPDGGVSDVDQLPALSPDPGCYNGVFFSYGPAKQDLKVPVASPGTLKIEAIDCYQSIGLRLIEPLEGKELANSGLKTAPDCPSLDVRVETAGSYILEVEKQNAADAGTVMAGDFYLRMSLTP